MPLMPVPDHASILEEIKTVRRGGIVRLRRLEVPSLARIAFALAPADARPAAVPAQSQSQSVEWLLRLAVSRLGGGTLQEAAEYTLGLTPGTRDWPGADRRRRAAELYGVSIERFRKEQEAVVLDQVAEQVGRLARAALAERHPAAGRDAAAGDAAHDDPADPADPAVSARTHRLLTVPAHGRTVPVTLHVHPVDLLRDVDVVVSPVNTYLALPEAYKSSVAASLRRAGALRGLTGEVLGDPIHDELRDWATARGTSGRPVLPGTVAVTGSGALAGQGVRRVYHAAVAVPRAGTNDYDVLPADVTRAVAHALELLAEEHERFDPPLRSVCFPLLGSGRGGLPYEESVRAVWAAVDAELARGAGWDIHLIVRGLAPAGLVVRMLTEYAGGSVDGRADGRAGDMSGGERSHPLP
ncbi:macro domain-containing protein [Streptomyces scopuliridis]|uniref:macro domain-containing protein n=1 Tax=Streptomyces scopuliridis TaxID=452529 RepID=UPI002DD7F452|nr:macro domain-containing protein [Streptomyces scopuliridis]WSB35996.1 macro domain-containing protein [Streptomyces scopuliridis]